MSKTLIFTGGHHSSALEVAGKLKNTGINIYWLGHRHSMWGDNANSAEYREVREAGIEFIELKAGKFYHTLNPAKLIRIPLGFIQAFFVLFKLQRQLKSELKGIVSFGGYLAVPVVFGGWLLHIPSITHEQTSVTGWANKFISLFVKKIAVSWPNSLSHYPKSKAVITGLPLREELLSITHHPTTPPTIYITGGKQGSHFINSVVFKTLPGLLNNYRIIHQVGSNSVFNDYQKAKVIWNQMSAHHQQNYKYFDYLSPQQVSNVFSQSSVVVSRAGAHIIYELAFAGLPCILIPLPNSSHNEQTNNAQILVSHHQAVLINQKNFTSETLTMGIIQSLQLSPVPLNIPTNGSMKMIQLIKQELL